MTHSHLIYQLEDRFLHHLDRVAVEDDGREYTYRQLRQCVHALARQINALQGASHHPVAVLGEPSYATVVCVLGVLFSGAIYLPIDPSWPLLRIKQLLKEANVRIVVGLQPQEGLVDGGHFISVGQGSVEKLGDMPITYFSLEEHLKMSIMKDDFLVPKKASSDLLYIMFTSGSMGYPKAVQVTSRSFEHFLCWVEGEFAITEKDRFAFISSLGFGASLRQIFSPLFSGGTIVCFKQIILKQPLELLKGLHEKQITIFNVPPIIIEQIVLMMPCKKYSLDHVRWVFVGGDLFHSGIAKKWSAHFKAKIVNLYGSTESIINASSYEVCPSFDAHHLLPIGKPRPDFIFHLQDERGNFIHSTHQSGLLVVESPFLAKGYYRTEDTKKVFYQKDGAYFYRTGDRAMQLPSGDYLVLGRMDRQIQLYGQRIELTEIENMLNQHPEIQRSFVVSIQDHTKICAYIQSDQLDMNIFRQFLKQRLPSFMLPHYIDRIGDIHITSSQKVDYQKLQDKASRKYAPSVFKREGCDQDIESQIKSIWMKYLGDVEDIGLEDSFFDRGGDSIMAVEVYHDLCQTFHIQNLDPFIFYTSPTIKKLSLEVQKAQKVMPSSVEKISSSGFRFKEFLSPSLIIFKILRKFNQIVSVFHWKKGVKKGPISPQQRYFITLKQLLGVNCNGYFSIPIKGDMDRERLKENLEKIVRSQESLRTYFVGDKQMVLPILVTDVLFYDLSSQGSKEQDKRIREIHETLLYEKVHFSRPPLFKVVLFKKSSHDFIFTLCINHILADGQSLHIFFSQLHQAYMQEERLRKVPSHIDYTIAYKKHCRKNYEKNSHFWKQKLLHIKDYNASLCVEKQYKSSPDEVLSIDQEKINFLCKKYHTTAFYIFMALWSQAFSKVMDLQKMYFFATYHNRSFPFKGLPDLIAPIARMAPVLLDLDTYDDFESVLQKATRAYLEILNHIDFNVFKHFYSYGKSHLVGFNYIDFNPLSRLTAHFPFKWDIGQADLRLLEGDVKYTYIFLSVHSYARLAKLRVYGRCPSADKKALLLSIQNRLEQVVI